jgi:hypothetical protein
MLLSLDVGRVAVIGKGLLHGWVFSKAVVVSTVSFLMSRKGELSVASGIAAPGAPL